MVIAHFGGGIAAVKDRLLAKGYRFGTLKRSFADYFEMLYFGLAGFEAVCRLCTVRFKASARSGSYSPATTRRIFTGVNTDTGKGMQELRNYIETIRKVPLEEETKNGILGSTAMTLLKV